MEIGERKMSVPLVSSMSRFAKNRQSLPILGLRAFQHATISAQIREGRKGKAFSLSFSCLACNQEGLFVHRLAFRSAAHQPQEQAHFREQACSCHRTDGLSRNPLQQGHCLGERPTQYIDLPRRERTEGGCLRFTGSQR